MDAVVSRIIEIEQKSASDIEQAEAACRMHIEEHQRTLQEEKERIYNNIISTENQRFNEAVQILNERTRKTLSEASKDYEMRFQNAAKAFAVKEKIIDILLAS